jgi:hypothetical protein
MKQGRSIRRFTAIALATALALGPGAAAQGAVFFSEYLEGSASNKALEIYNSSAKAVDLAGFEVRVYANGSATATGTVSLTGRTVPAGGTLVMAHPSSVPALLALAQMTSGSLNFNGDDAVALFAGGVPLDHIGQVGFDPGDAWGSAALGTRDQTLRRLSAVTEGDVNIGGLFDPAGGWSSFPVDTFSGLGQHASAPPSVPLPPSLALLASAVGGLGLLRRRPHLLA